MINNPLIPAPFPADITPSLELTQIEGYEPLKSFKDSNGIEWNLVKDSRNSFCEIPDPSSINITDCWNHEYPGMKGKVYIYVVEGIKIPKTVRETSCNVLYCWFSRIFNKNFNPSMIKPNEWLMANVYASSCTDTRVSKLKALCKIKDEAPKPQPIPDNKQTPLINISALGNSDDGSTEQQA